MNVAYGIKVKASDDPYILNAEEALYGLAEAGIPGTFLVDFLPFLKHVPNWFPGATFKRKADRWNKVNKEVYMKPFQDVEEQMVCMRHFNTAIRRSNSIATPQKKGTAVPCLASTLIEMLPEEGDPLREEERKVAMNTCAVTYVGTHSFLILDKFWIFIF